MNSHVFVGLDSNLGVGTRLGKRLGYPKVDVLTEALTAPKIKKTSESMLRRQKQWAASSGAVSLTQVSIGDKSLFHSLTLGRRIESQAYDGAVDMTGVSQVATRSSFAISFLVPLLQCLQNTHITSMYPTEVSTAVIMLQCGQRNGRSRTTEVRGSSHRGFFMRHRGPDSLVGPSMGCLHA